MVKLQQSSKYFMEYKEKENKLTLQMKQQKQQQNKIIDQSLG